ncbi:MAG: phenylalanine--tRNA ligase subunit beta [Bacteroidales bacterium]|nr:phenylalanine--tRNA ligase subunit beta [Bacteroidales bacterium]MDZ4203522.1 phenylalanine--tRNA ligase subunit beta [Bacteroidales bacterium]
MKISCNWLRKYTGIETTPEQIAQILSNCGLEVEGTEVFETVKGSLKGVVVGEVRTCVKDHATDKLSLTTVDIGSAEPLNIVCGAPNVRAGQKVLVATVGTTLYMGENQLIINKTKIRGKVSEGMICAEDELGLGTSHDGIMVLDSSVKPGMPAAGLFNISNDVVLEIGLTPNRADAASYIGVARDLIAAWNTLHVSEPHKHAKLQLPDISGFSIDNTDLPIPVEVMDADACPRYSGITISSIKVAASPLWLESFLKASGVRPINNIVDITNFVLLELGQPLHAFDAEKIKGQKVVVRTLPEGTPFNTLDGIERILTADNLMVCDALEGMCIGGVFGGQGSGVSEQTTSIFLESAYFNPVSIRKTSKHHGLKTDASFRFERGTDPNITVFALKRAAMLIREIAGGSISSKIADVYPKPIDHRLVEVTYENVKRLIGKRIDTNIILNMLPWLGIEIIRHNEQGFVAAVPPLKPDVYREVDIIEEILRIYGYNNIEIDQPLRSSISISEKPDRHALRNHVSDFLTHNAFYEIMCNSLSKSAYAQDFPFLLPDKFVTILNPISRDLDVMRQTLLIGGCEAIVFNMNRKNNDLKFYEFGKVYFRDPSVKANDDQVEGYNEHWRLGIFVTGLKQPESWRHADDRADFFSLKAIVAKIFERLGIENAVNSIAEVNPGIFEYALTYQANGQVVSELGKLKHDIARKFDIKQDVFYADINWDLCITLVSGRNALTYKALPKYPEVRRDLSLLVNTATTFDAIVRIARKTEAELLRNINLFDVYEGDRIEKGKKSYAVSFILRDDTKTLKDEDIEGIMYRLLGAFEKELGAQLR